MKLAKLTSQDILHIANLAQLTFDNSFVSVYATELDAIFNFISTLQSIPTKHVAICSHVTGLSNVFRDDEVDTARMLTQTEALANAKAHHKGYFLVPYVLDMA